MMPSSVRAWPTTFASKPADRVKRCRIMGHAGCSPQQALCMQQQELERPEPRPPHRGDARTGQAGPTPDLFANCGALYGGRRCFPEAESAVTVLFWLSVVLVVYAYFGYAMCLWVKAKLASRPVLRRPITPSVSIIIAAHNEETNLPAKLENLRSTEYPRELLQIVIASDGSTDRTASILREHTGTVLPVILDQNDG